MLSNGSIKALVNHWLPMVVLLSAGVLLLSALLFINQAAAHSNDSLLAPSASAGEQLLPMTNKLQSEPTQIGQRVVASDKVYYGHYYQLQPEPGPLLSFIVDQRGQRHYLMPGQELPEVSGGQRVALRADKLVDRRGSSRLRVESFRTLTARNTPLPTTGRGGLFLVSLSWPGYRAPQLNSRDYQKITDWSAQASDRRWTWSPVTVKNIQLGPQELCASQNSYGQDVSWSRSVWQWAAGAGYDLTKYRALGIVVPSGAGCPYSAHAYSGCQMSADQPLCSLSVYSPGSHDPTIVIHELGHTMGLNHASSLYCQQQGLAVSLTYSGTCRIEEYGDFYDPMGFSFTLSMYNVFYTQQLGWLPAGDLTYRRSLRPGRQTARLDSFGSLRRKRSMIIALPPAPAGPQQQLIPPGEISIETKGYHGADRLLYDRPRTCLINKKNLFIRYRPSPELATIIGINANRSYLVDVRPQTADICDSRLRPGDSWSDPSGQLRVTFNGLDRRERAQITLFRKR